MIPLAKPFIGASELANVQKVLESGMLVQGPMVAALEQTLTPWLAPGFSAVAVSNGTAALHLALLALDTGPGDTVIVPTYSWPATANVVELTGARPLFVDIDSHSYNMDPQKLDAAIRVARRQTNCRLKAVMVVHAFGCPANMDEIMTVANKVGLPVIEDAACAIGASWNRQAAGTMGVLGCFSLHPRKIITTGEGGLLAVKDKTVADKLRALRNHGQAAQALQPDFIMPGFNYRMTDLQAALGLAQFERLSELLARQRQVAGWYTRLLADSSVTPQYIAPQAITNYQAYVVMLPEPVSSRDMINRLARAGIASNIGTWHIPLTSYYQKRYQYKPGDFPATDQVFKKALALPIHSELTYEQVEFIVQTLLAAIGI